QDKGPARAPCPPARGGAGPAGGRAGRDEALPDRLGPTGREDPHLQLPREPSHRPPRPPDGAQAGQAPRGRARRRHRGARGRRPAPSAGMTVGEVLRRASGYLEERGVESPRLDAELLLGKALGRSRLDLYLEHDRPLDESELAVCRKLLERRGQREPLAYVLGEWGFRRLALRGDERVLIPRPETEVVVGRALELLEGSVEPRVLDLGTGSGAIALAIVDEHPGARVTGVDRSTDALTVARENAERLGLAVELREGGVEVTEEGWDLVVSNPPYVAPDELESLQPEIHREPLE